MLEGLGGNLWERGGLRWGIGMALAFVALAFVVPSLFEVRGVVFPRSPGLKFNPLRKIEPQAFGALSPWF